jgi:antitoxin (DNA-binding transcriptional repressor) of toxin-antitoxin stability system
MKSATIRDLRNEFPRVARWIEEGECVEITRSGKPFAQLAPIPPPATRHVATPDFLARIRENFPNEKPGKGLSSVVDYDRSDR